ncbi:MAG TPA: molybdopterin cofactor-binding domain-containing protein [Azospirillaceae bacterium]|nr:molybdopterin cofactor-binding domain-containing protein [Azospirillaceae bacterium]
MAADRSRRGVSRRGVLIGALTAGGCLLVGSVPARARAAAAADALGTFGPFLRIGPDGTVTVVSKFSELGQGAQSGMAALVAEELDADWSRVRVETAPADQTRYGHSRMKIQITGGSGSITDSYDQLRRAGAAARAMFVSAAAGLWGVPASEITVRDGVVAHPASARSSGFGPLVAAAARVTPPEEPVLKPAADYRLVGTDRVTRLDAQAKSTGATRFTQDVQLPGMLVAMVAHPPRFGGQAVRFDAAAARTVPGFVNAFLIPSGVAVVARDTYAARTARDALRVEWDESAAERRSSEAIRAEYRAIAAGEAAAEWAPFEAGGAIGAALDDPGRTVTLDLDFPFLAHATMEPMNCVAQVEGKRVKLTYGTQSHTADQRNVAAIVGCTPEEVEIETLPAGGSFGRRSVATSDYQKECVEIARRVGGFVPVKLVWTREDDMAAGYYRPLTHHRARIALDADGYPAAWEHRIVSASLLRGTPFEAAVRDGVDKHVVEGTLGSPYFKATPAVDARVCSPPSRIPVLWLRSVGATHTAMAMEHMVDRLARRAGIDPVAYRRTLYDKAGAASHRAVLDLAAEKAGWGRPLEAGWARGVAVHASFGSTVANVAEVSLVDGEPRVRRVVVAIDCGLAVSPDQVRAQMEGGVMYGLSYSLFGEVRIEDGIVRNTNFDSYRVLRMDEAPEVEVHILPSAAAPTGVGEPGTPVVGPAVANALLALTGEPTTSLPFVKA